MWFAEFWEENFNCKLGMHGKRPGSLKKCTGKSADFSAVERLGLFFFVVCLFLFFVKPFGRVNKETHNTRQSKQMVLSL